MNYTNHDRVKFKFELFWGQTRETCFSYLLLGLDRNIQLFKTEKQQKNIIYKIQEFRKGIGKYVLRK